MLDRPKLIGSSRWREHPVFIVGGGPSAAKDLEAIRGRGLAIAVNDSFKGAPWADAIFTIDDSWLKKRALELGAWRNGLIAALPIGMKPPAAAGQVEVIERREGCRKNPDPAICYYGENSGFGCLNTAIANGAGKAFPIFLLGFDMGAAGHWHKGYEWNCRFGVKDYPRWVKYFEILAPEWRALGVDIVNLNPDSNIRCFRFGELEPVLSECTA